MINRNYARRHLLVPVSCIGPVLTISMNDPTNHAVVDDLTRSTGYIVNVVTSSHESIKRAFKRLYEESVEPEAAASATDVVEVQEDSGGV